MRKYYLEGFLATAGAATSGAVAANWASTVWAVVAVLLGSVAVACFTASLRPKQAHRSPTTPKRRPRRLGVPSLLGITPSTLVPPRLRHRR